MQFVQTFRYAIGTVNEIKSGRDIALSKKLKDVLPRVEEQLSDIILIPHVVGAYQLTKFVPDCRSEEKAVEDWVKRREEGIKGTASALGIYDPELNHDLIQVGYDPRFRLDEIELLMGKAAKARIKIVPYDSLASAHKKPIQDVKEMMDLHQQRALRALKERAEKSLCKLVGIEFDRNPQPECRELYRHGCQLLEGIRSEFGLTQDEYNALLDCRNSSSNSEKKSL
jgi:hypothetical protein